MKHLTDEERATLIERIFTGLESRGEDIVRSEWLGRLCVKVAKRSPRHLEDIKVRDAFKEQGEELPDWSPRDADWFKLVGDWTVDEMIAVRTREDFQVIEKVIVHKDDAALDGMLERLNSQLKIKGMLYNRGVSPEEEHPKILSKIWEAMSKWDGRDFTAYIARTIKNHAIDVLKAKRKAMSEMPETVADGRPGSRTRDQAEARDALGHILSVLDDLEGGGTIGPLDGALFSLILKGRGVTELVEQLTERKTVPALKRAFEAVVTKKKLKAPEALALQALMDGLTPAEAARMTRVDRAALEAAREHVAEALAADAPIARALCRSKLSLTEIDRCLKITPNAINLRVNRLRLKVWQAMCDRSFALIKRRVGDINTIEQAIVDHRCTAPNQPPCKMYKDRSCKREASPEEIIAAAGLEINKDEMAEQLEAFRDKILDDLGRIFPDYNSCLFERKSSH